MHSSSSCRTDRNAINGVSICYSRFAGGPYQEQARWRPHLVPLAGNLLPVQPQLADPLEGVGVLADALHHLLDDVPSVDLNGDQRHHLQPLDLGQVPSDGLRVALEQGHLGNQGEARTMCVYESYLRL